MASSNYDFDDQTDEDFFDKLVDGELDDSESNVKVISRNLSNLSIESDFSKNNGSLKGNDAEKNDSLTLTSSSEMEIGGVKSDLPKQSNVKEVQWGAFSVDGSNECESSSTFDCLSFSVENPNVFEKSLAENVSSKNENLKSGDTEKNDCLATSDNFSGLDFGAKSGISKQTSVKEVQWVACSSDISDEIVRSQISDYSGFLVEDLNGGFVGSMAENINTNVVLVDNQDSFTTEHLDNNDLILEKSVSVNSNGVKDDTKSNASKGTCVKEVKWSDFNANDSKDFENIYGVDSFDSYQAPSIKNSNEFVDKFSLTTSSVDNQYNYSNSGEYTTDQNDPQYWENLYPGWKFDSSSGQWYLINNGIATTDPQLNNLNVSSADSVFVNSNASYEMFQPTQSVLETTTEENTVTSNSNLNSDSQGIISYPPHMAFDPQYPGWYYDTNTQEWYTLESYSLRVNGDSDAVQDRSPGQNNSMYSKGQEEGRHEFGQSWDASMSSYNQKNDLDNNSITHSQQTVDKNWGSQESSQEWSSHEEQNHFFSNVNQSEQMDQNITTKAYAQQSMWLPRPLKSHIEDASLSNNYYSNQAMINFSQQSYNGANTCNQSETQINQNMASESNVQQTMWQPQSLKSHIEVASLTNNNHGATINSSQQSFNGANTYYQSDMRTGQNTATITNSQQSMWEPQPHKSHIKDAISSKSNYADQDTMSYSQPNYSGASAYDLSEKQTNRNMGSKPYAQQNTWQPQPLKSQIEDDLKSSYGDQATMNHSHQSHYGANVFSSQFANAPVKGRSSAGRPPHALVTFGFGGKFLVMKDASGANVDRGDQVNGRITISVLNLPEVLTEKSDYFSALCQSSFPGPLVGGNAALKDVNKWVDEKIGKHDTSVTEFHNTKSKKMLYSLLKIMCQHYGKLRSPFSADLSLETDGPDASVTELFASAKKDGTQLTEFGSLTHCVRNIPSEGQIQATAIEVQKLLVSGKRKDALQYAQEGQLWGPALVLASQLGDNLYVDTVKKMAECQFSSGTPLRTLCLLIAGKPTDVFSYNGYPNSFYGASMGTHGSTQVSAKSILDDWEENLAIISANRTKDDELVIIHLGDCLYKERAEIIPAHLCYLLAEANFELYSDNARLCLVGADHFKCPRTYASPEAIQRTEVYEYSKVLGNSQFVLLPLQPYKLIYAYMLTEVGKVSDSLRYCQSLQKSLKNPGQAPEIEIWRVQLSSLEERLRTHQQGGYSSNLAPTKLVGKIFNSLDRSINRMIRSPPPTAPLPSVPSMPQNGANIEDNFFNPASKVASSQSTLDVASLMPSASVEAISQWSSSGNTTSTRNRSISEPEFGRTSEQNPSKDAKDAVSGKVQGNSSDNSSKIGRIGSQLFQKTFGWVSKSREAKLGESNKFYYDEKLKRWVEEGVEPPAEEITPPPPPKAPTFQNGASDYNISRAFNDNSPPNGMMEQKSSASSEPNFGIPPIPPTQNQFSARGRTGLRSRYVDTFNKGASNSGIGMAKSSFQSPMAPSIKPAINTKFFVPTPPSPSNDDNQTDTVKAVSQEPIANTEPSSSATKEMTFLPQTSSSLQKFPSMDNIPRTSSHGVAGPSSYSRAVSWSGVYPDTSNQNPQSTPSSVGSSQQLDGAVLGDELQEVEL